MDKYVIKTKRILTPLESSSVNNINSTEQENNKRARIEDEISDEVIGDPGKRIPIDSYPVNMRDSMRRQYLVRGPSQPNGHVFPFSIFGNGKGKQRRFQVQWFKSYPWLEYSVSKDCVFCLHCYLFASGNKFGDGAFTRTGFRNWRKALDSFKLHEGGKTSSHHYANQKLVQYKNQRENVDHVLASKCSILEAEYRIRLTAVVHVIRYLLEAGTTFRGHDESKKSKHPGKFLLLIRWYCKRDEGVRKVSLSNAPGNNQLTSGRIQKQIIFACAIETRKIILNEIGDKVFSLLIDEARDCSVKEQMAIVLRFVNDRGEVIDRFIGLVHISDTSAPCLKKAIDHFFAQNRLSFSRLRGQGYDGASNMRGKFHGLKALILNENKLAHYVHCFAHQLQLVVIAMARKCTPVSKFFDYLPMIVSMIGASCKRKNDLQQLHHDKLVK
ncbi:General transcription factor 2-related zinc finger protein [Euphorbia peplus]|nr:General transcription factor 2-related zinc finger protein [Euphorbia peplus]